MRHGAPGRRRRRVAGGAAGRGRSRRGRVRRPDSVGLPRRPVSGGNRALPRVPRHAPPHDGICDGAAQSARCGAPGAGATAAPRRVTSVSQPATARLGAVRPLKIGVQLPEVEREVRWPELLDMIRAIEDLGFDSIWLGEHLLYRWPDLEPRGPWEAWSTLAAIAAVTNRVEFGPLVACTSFHNPALLAKQAVTIDEISGGRLV